MMPPAKKKKKEKSPLKQEAPATPDPMTQYHNPNSLWNGFPMYENYQPVYPGMVNPGYVPPLQNVMRIGECSIKPVGQQYRFFILYHSGVVVYINTMKSTFYLRELQRNITDYFSLLLTAYFGYINLSLLKNKYEKLNNQKSSSLY